MYVVTVLFELNPGDADAFRAAIVENARTSLREEAGCHRFDVSFSADGLRCFLYELYTDAAAFQAHLRAAHFVAFDDLSRAMVLTKRVETFGLASNGSQPPPA